MIRAYYFKQKRYFIRKRGMDMKAQDIKEDKSLWEKKHLEGVGKVLLVEESYYDSIVEWVDSLEKENKRAASKS